jgi:hypothetical protein
MKRERGSERKSEKNNDDLQSNLGWTSQFCFIGNLEKANSQRRKNTTEQSKPFFFFTLNEKFRWGRKKEEGGGKEEGKWLSTLCCDLYWDLQFSVGVSF